ncbi:MAG: hypothetical protein AABX79_02640 [Nanoarchaeota archaeon]
MAFEDTIKELEETSCDIADSMRENIRSSKHGKLKILALESCSLISGIALGSIARASGTPEITVILPMMDFFLGGFPLHSQRAVRGRLYEYAKYAIGAALPYADKIYIAAKSLSDNLN